MSLKRFKKQKLSDKLEKQDVEQLKTESKKEETPKAKKIGR